MHGIAHNIIREIIGLPVGHPRLDTAARQPNRIAAAMVIAAMQGGSVPQDQYNAYNTYVAKSNQICKPNY